MIDAERAAAASRFIQLLNHTKGKYAGKPFILLPWQQEVTNSFYGTVGEDGRRQYQYLYLEIPKKNGKSELGAALALYHTFADGEANGEIYGCASDREQASLIFDVAVDMVDQNKALKRRAKLTLSKKELSDTVTKSRYKVLSAESYSKHGLNASAVIFDELHAQPDRNLWDVMTFGAFDAREEPVCIVLTTAGNDPDRNSIGWEIHDKAQRIISGELTDPRWCCRIWGLPPDYEGDIWSEELWYRVNPSLGSIIDISKVRQAAMSARNSEAEERNFRWLRLNQWVANKTTSWLPLTLWDEHAEDIQPERLVGKRCYLGLDLSSIGDLTAIARLFPPQDGLDHYYAMFDTFIPANSMAEHVRTDAVPYDIWSRGGYVTPTAGDVIDYNYIKARIEQLCGDGDNAGLYDVCDIGNDPWGAEKLRQDLICDAGIEMTAVRQNIANMSPAMKEIERLLRNGELKHGTNPLVRWAFGNVVVATDGNDNYKPVKAHRTERIDPIVALINAMYVCQKGEAAASVYERRGIITA